MASFDLASCARPNILQLQPYRCARDDYEDNGSNVLLDANENAFGPASSVDMASLGRLNRYPDPHQVELKQLLCSLRSTKTHTQRPLRPENVFVGVGSDEAIDALLRCFCRPGVDKILTCPPTYGMYAVSAQVNDVEVVSEPLGDASLGFPLQPARIAQTLLATAPATAPAAAPAAAPATAPAGSVKLVYVCSPGNPTGNLVAKSDIEQLLRLPGWNGLVVVDEAYIDFAPDGASLAEWVLEWPNLVVLQTLSKAFGLAAIRLGVAFASAPVARLLNSLKAPYNISQPTSVLARAALSPRGLAAMRSTRAQILAQRDRLVRELPRIPGVGRLLGGLHANFLLVEILDRPGGRPSNTAALRVYHALAERHGIVVRFRGREPGCHGCLRITVGTEHEVSRVLQELAACIEFADS